MNLNYFKRMGATICFFLMAVLYAAVIWGLALAGHEAVAGQSSNSLITQIASFVGYAVLAGLMVDLSRLMLSALWGQVWTPRRKRVLQRDEYVARSYAYETNS